MASILRLSFLFLSEGQSRRSLHFIRYEDSSFFIFLSLFPFPISLQFVIDNDNQLVRPFFSLVSRSLSVILPPTVLHFYHIPSRFLPSIDNQQACMGMFFVWRFSSIRRTMHLFSIQRHSRHNLVCSLSIQWIIGKLPTSSMDIAACQHLDKVKWYDRIIRVTPSKHTSVQMPKEGMYNIILSGVIKSNWGQPDAGLTKDYSHSTLHRFKKPGQISSINQH